MSTVKGNYFVKKQNEEYQDFEDKFKGVTVFAIDKLGAIGKPKNITIQEWVNSNRLDVYVPDVVTFESTDADLSFYVWDFEDKTIDVKAVHDTFINYMMTNAVFIKSKFLNVENQFICIKEYTPTEVVLQQGAGSNYILGTLTLRKVNSLNTNI